MAREITVRLRAEVADFKRSMADAAQASDKTSAAFDKNGQKIQTVAGRMVRSAEINREAWSTAGTTLTTFGAVGVAALGLSAKAAIDWESAWTGVLKTVDGSHEQLSQLEEDLRGMALEMPASATEIAAVAEAAGQLGVQTDSVAAFTRVMVNLGETTNLTADEAATSIAQLMNVMQTAPEDVDNLGSALVALGNNGASTERDIIQMAQRIGGAGSIIGLSEAQVLGLANALASAGIEVEAGGSAISNIMIDIAKSVSEGGDDLTAWADVAGMSAQEFATAWNGDPASALATTIEGLGRMNAAGEDVFGTLESLGQSDVRVTRALLSMATSGDLLRKSLALGSEAWDENLALIEEAEKRYDTTEAKIAIARNSINEAAIVIGENLLPALAGMAEGVAGAAQAFANLPSGMQGALTTLGGVATVAALAGGAFLVLAPRVMDSYDAFKRLSHVAPGAATGLGKVTRAVGLATAALTTTTIAIEAMNAATVETAGAGEFTRALLEVADGANIANTSLSGLFDSGGFTDWFNGNDIDSISAAFDRIANSSWDETLADAINKVGSFGGSMSAAREQSQEIFDGIDQGLTSLVQSGNADRASDALSQIAAQIGTDRKSLRALLPEYRDALAETDVQQGLTADSSEDLTEAVVSYSDALAEQIDLQREASGVALDEFDALTQYADAVESATAALYDENDALIEGAATLDVHSEAGRANRDALSSLAESTWAWIDAGVAAGASTSDLSERMDEGRDAFINAAEQMGLTADEAEDLADKMGLVPESIVTAVKVTGLDTANQKLDYLRSQMGKIDGRYVVAGVSTGRGSTFATGGAVHGPGTSTSDSIPAMLSDGEWVHRAAAVDFWGTRTMDAINRNDIAGVWAALDARGFAGGGQASYSMPAPVVNVAAPVVDMSGFGGGMPSRIEVPVVIGAREVARAVRELDRSLS